MANPHPNAGLSDARLAGFGKATPYPGAPEVCVEILSPSNTWGEMHRKAGLYLQAGAEEAWLVHPDGERRVVRA